VALGKILVACGWPYVNHLPHLGTLVQVLSADVAARYYRLKGEEVVMVSGSDEHGTPIEVEAVKQGISPKDLSDRNHKLVSSLLEKWGISFNNYTRTESPVHKDFVRDFHRKIEKNGYVFTQETELPRCPNCQRFLPDRFVEGRCPFCGDEEARGDQCEKCGKLLDPDKLINPRCTICGTKPIFRRVTHWYFDLPKFAEQLLEYIENNKQLPGNARNFSLNFIKEGLKPRPLTRDSEWGILAPFKGAEDKTLYVWFENVLGYVSATIEYFRNRGEPEKWKEYWFNKDAKTLYFIGKDNIPFHTIIFPALLLASHEDYNLPWNVSATEFLQYKGEAFSKSRRIGVWIDEALELFPADCWRYFVIATRPETKDTNFSWELFIEKVNADLNDTFGNFIHRTLTFINTRFNSEVPKPSRLDQDDELALKTLEEKVKTIAKEIEACRLQSAANNTISTSRIGNQYLNEKEPWNVIKKDMGKAANTIYVAAQVVKALAIVSAPFIPFAAEELWRILNLPGSVHEQKWDEALNPLPASHKVGRAKPLFQKIEADSEKLAETLEKVRERSSKTA
jgi:methionyl-tRNA synthetase